MGVLSIRGSFHLGPVLGLRDFRKPPALVSRGSPDLSSAVLKVCRAKGSSECNRSREPPQSPCEVLYIRQALDEIQGKGLGFRV